MSETRDRNPLNPAGVRGLFSSTCFRMCPGGVIPNTSKFHGQYRKRYVWRPGKFLQFKNVVIFKREKEENDILKEN